MPGALAADKGIQGNVIKTCSNDTKLQDLFSTLRLPFHVYIGGLRDINIIHIYMCVCVCVCVCNINIRS